VGAGSQDPYHKAFNGFFFFVFESPTHTEDVFLRSRTLLPFELKLATELLQFQFWGASPNFWDFTLGATTLEAMTVNLMGDPGGARLLPFPSLPLYIIHILLDLLIQDFWKLVNPFGQPILFQKFSLLGTRSNLCMEMVLPSRVE
jgi:hypothetical protein